MTQLEAFFWKRVTKTEGCWEWHTGKGVKPKAYGNITLYGGPYEGLKCVSAHRASWIIHYGDIPDGVVVRHDCDNPSCVNPRHLRLGTQSQNIQDAVDRGRKQSGYALYQRRKTHCPQGHPYNEENTTVSFYNGRANRHCRVCGRIRKRERKIK